MAPTAKLVYKTRNSTLNYVNNAIDYVISLGYYCSVTTEGHLRYDNLPEAVFILTAESSSSYISKDQYQAMWDAQGENIPVYIIYRRKETNELNVYTVSFRKTNLDSDDSYAHINDFKRTEFESYFEGESKIRLKQLGTLLNPYDPDNYDEVIEDEVINNNELLLLI